MNRIKLHLADPDAYKQPFKSQYSDINNIDKIFEILGSIEKLEGQLLKINITITNSNMFIFHNGKPFDQDDIQRFIKVATHKLTNNRKGVSKQGTGLRAVLATLCVQNIDFEDENYNYTTDDFYKCSSVITKVNTDIIIENKNHIKKDNILTFIHDSNFNINYCDNETFYNNIYQKNLDDEYGVLFSVPNNSEIDKNEDELIIHKLKLLFNRLDCSFIYSNENTSCYCNIFEKKPFYYVDYRIQNNRYLECDCEIFTYNEKKILRLKIIKQRDIDPELNTGDYHYFWIATKKNSEDIIKKYDYNDWKIDIKDESILVPENYKFKLRMMSFDSDEHKNNDDFKKWFNFYSHHTTGFNYGDGIVPYIEDQCLRYDNYEGKKKYLSKDFGMNPTQKIHRGNNYQGQLQPQQWHRITYSDKKIFYKHHQNYLCEYIEEKNVDSDKSILNINPIKSYTKVCDSQKKNGKGMNKSLPYFFLWLAHKYVWYEAKTETISKTPTEIISNLEEANKKANNEAKKAKRESKQANKEAKLAKKEADIAKKKSEKEKKRADREEQKKIISMNLTDRVSQILKETDIANKELENSIKTEYIAINEEKNISEGSCYCLFDPTRPKWRKIGKSSCKLKKDLMNQYSPRYMPLSIDIIEWTEFNNSTLAEKHIFEKLKKYREKKTEWFYFDNENCDDIIKKCFNDYDTFIKSNSY